MRQKKEASNAKMRELLRRSFLSPTETEEDVKELEQMTLKREEELKKESGEE
jgi:hypothetical protein